MQCIQNYYVHLYKLPGILLKENDKLKNATDVFLYEKHNNVNSCCRGASIVISNISLTGDTHKIFVSNICFKTVDESNSARVLVHGRL